MDIASKFLPLRDSAHGRDDAVTDHESPNVLALAFSHEFLDKNVLLRALKRFNDRLGNLLIVGQNDADTLGALEQLDDHRRPAHTFDRRKDVGLVSYESGVRNADVGYAGKKDRHAITRQWFSVPRLDPARARALERSAVAAMHEASKTGRRFCFSAEPAMARSADVADSSSELRQAMDGGQLELFFQPRVDIRDRRVTGVEALLRWNHPIRGFVGLEEVLALAKATGLIVPLGDWVLRAACERARSWPGADELKVSVNLSQQEFAREDLPRLVSNALQDTSLPPGKLELELTEAMLMRNRQADTTIRELDKLGVGIVLDDFGQGHSSIVHLTELPIKALKIDRAFVEHTREPGRQQSICAAVLAMSKELGISVIAEGVESELQVQFLKERGCDAVQGFLFTEPLPPENVPNFVSTCAEIAAETKVVDLTTVRHKIASRALS